VYKQYPSNFNAVHQVTGLWYPTKIEGDVAGLTKQWSVIKFLNAETFVPTEIYQHLKNVIWM
jgi:hypothetical protein